MFMVLEYVLNIKTFDIVKGLYKNYYYLYLYVNSSNISEHFFITINRSDALLKNGKDRNRDMCICVTDDDEKPPVMTPGMNTYISLKIIYLIFFKYDKITYTFSYMKIYLNFFE